MFPLHLLESWVREAQEINALCLHGRAAGEAGREAGSSEHEWANRDIVNTELDELWMRQESAEEGRRYLLLSLTLCVSAVLLPEKFFGAT